ncbi:MAG: hypothetical protein MMC23_003521 [Stictis urceolatum]|nr:hypothetical protein [Stictis urceolata]
MSTFSAVSSCCALLLAAPSLSPLLSLPSTPAYAATLASYWSLQQGTQHPSCILTPSTPSQISTALTILSSHPTCHFALKGQAHAPAANFSNIDNGVTIDLTHLDTTTVSYDTYDTTGDAIARIGPGATWLSVYRTLDAHGLAVAGGRNGAVGVGGLVLGGGISYFAPRVGWACDTVSAFEVVLGDGKMVRASRSEHPDLFRALKGGAGNLGAVTGVEMRAFKQGDILAGALVQEWSDREKVFSAVEGIATGKGREDGYDEFASLVMAVTFNSSSKVWSVSETLAYTKEVERPAVYEGLFEIKNVTDQLHFTNLSTFSAEKALPQLDWIFYTGTYAAKEGVLKAIVDIAQDVLGGFEPEGGVFWAMAFEPLPTKITQWGDRNGGNVLGTEPTDGDAFVVLVSPFWTNSAISSDVHATASKFVGEVDAQLGKKGLVHKFQYANYADPSQDPIGSYGATNVKRLRDASKKYDPKGLFQKQVPGGFKLP